jgi:4-amino-4-deoxy-L-arabinose transferase-like glycosyltransferase
MTSPSPSTLGSTWLTGRRHWFLIVGLLGIGTALALTSLETDSVTFDETYHLVSGYSFWKTGDFRLTPDHPPLARLWASLPLLTHRLPWPPADDKAWVLMDSASFCVKWLFGNDAQHLVILGRRMMVVLLVATWLSTYALARTLLGTLAGLLTLLLAILSPTLLAHGRLITTDLPITLCTVLVLLTFARLLHRLTWGRMLAAALSLAAAAATKLSWPLLLPALFIMAICVILRRQPLEVPVARQATPASAATTPTPSPWRPVTSRWERAGLLAGATLFIGGVVWVGIWSAYGWQSTIIVPLPEEASPEARTLQQQTVDAISTKWQIALLHTDGTPRRGFVPWFLRTAAGHSTESGWSLLPDAYLFGLAQTLQFTAARRAYFCGQLSDDGWRSYFPVAFAIKTPVATLLLLVAGISAILLRRAAVLDRILLVGLVAFFALYAAAMIASRNNLGQRHLLPLYPLAFVLAGAAAAWLATRHGKWLVGGALVWLLGANFYIHPQYLAYFNELIGGPSRGHLYLADSNIDWGQDLLRLRDYANRHPAEPIKLAYFGSAWPPYYLRCTALPSYFQFKPPAVLEPGTYVVSVTQLLGIYDLELRDSFWTPRTRAAYVTLGQIARSIPDPNEPPQATTQRAQSAREYGELRQKLLLNRLRHRAPDARIGYSLFVYHLQATDLAELTRP